MFCNCFNALRIVNLYICFCLLLRACLVSDPRHHRHQEAYVQGASMRPPQCSIKRTPPCTDHRGPTIRTSTTRIKAAAQDVRTSVVAMSTVPIPVVVTTAGIPPRLETLAAKVRAVTHLYYTTFYYLSPFF